MAWCRQATSHYLNLCWSPSISPYGATGPQWVKTIKLQHHDCRHASKVTLYFFTVSRPSKIIDRFLRGRDFCFQNGQQNLTKYLEFSNVYALHPTTLLIGADKVTLWEPCAAHSVHMNVNTSRTDHLVLHCCVPILNLRILLRTVFI